MKQEGNCIHFLLLIYKMSTFHKYSVIPRIIHVIILNLIQQSVIPRITDIIILNLIQQFLKASMCCKVCKQQIFLYLILLKFLRLQLSTFHWIKKRGLACEGAAITAKLAASLPLSSPLLPAIHARLFNPGPVL